MASSLPDGDTLIKWQYARQTARALPPGTKPTLPPSGGTPPSQSTAQESVTQGAFKLNTTTGVMQTIPPEITPDPLPPLHSNQAIDGNLNRGFLSVDGRDYLISTRTGANEEEKYNLTIYDAGSGNVIGSFKSAIAAFPFVVTSSTIIYQSGPSVVNTPTGLVCAPVPNYSGGSHHG